jgi:alpha-maltose-1-phosphate synthase
VDPEAFAADFAQHVNRLIADPELASMMGRAGRRRAIEDFGWPSIGEETVSVYRSVTAAADQHG